MTRTLALGQGAYYLVTGLWPLVSMSTFKAVTGPKREDWLVRMVGLLAASIGAGLALAGRRRTVAPELRVVGLLSAASFAAIDVYYAARRRISPVYLLDGLPEAVFVAGWASALAGARRQPR
jgi:energy-converting hydrogenase Eha subunit E